MKRTAVLCAIAIAWAGSFPARADDIADLKVQIRMLGEKVELLERSREEAKAAVPAPAPPQVTSAPLAPTPTGKLPVLTSGPFSVEIYGVLLPLFSPIRASGNTPAAPLGGATQVPAAAYASSVPGTRTAFTVGSSNIGFRGSYALTEDVKALFQVEAGALIDGSPGPNTFGSRNSWAGFQSDTYGFAFFGTNYTPYWYTCCAVSILKGASISDTILAGIPGFNIPTITQQTTRSGTVADASFSRRQGNSLNYWSPKFAGFSARVAYSTNENKAASVANGPVVSPTVASAALFYQNGPLDIRYGYEQHRDYFGLAFLGGAPGATVSNPHARDFGNALTASYKLPTKTQVGLTFERLNYNTSDSAVGNVRQYSRDMLQLFGVQTVGPHSVSLRLSKAQAGHCERVGDAGCTTNGLGAKAWNIIYLYNVMPSLDLYGTAWQLRNDRSATYTTTDRNAVPGEKQTGYGVGFQFVY